MCDIAESAADVVVVVGGRDGTRVCSTTRSINPQFVAGRVQYLNETRREFRLATGVARRGDASRRTIERAVGRSVPRARSPHNTARAPSPMRRINRGGAARDRPKPGGALSHNACSRPDKRRARTYDREGARTAKARARRKDVASYGGRGLPGHRQLVRLVARTNRAERHFVDGSTTRRLAAAVAAV